MKWLACLLPPVFGPCYLIKTVFEVPNRHFALVTNEEDDIKKTIIFGPGYEFFI